MGFLSFLTGGGASIIETIGNVADELITSDEERLEKENESLKTNLNYKTEMKALDIKEEEIFLEDKQSARTMNSELIASKDWLVRNTGSLMAWVIVIGTMTLDYMVAFNGLQKEVADKEILMFILGAMNTYTAGVISFYFGSSKSEADAQRVK